MTAPIVWIGASSNSGRWCCSEAAVWWDARVEASLDRAPAQKARWVGLLESCPPEHRPGLAYLVAYLPTRDLESLSTEAMAGQRGPGLPGPRRGPLGRGPAGRGLPRRGPAARQHDGAARADAGRVPRPIPADGRDCRRPGQAALALNKALFRDYKVVYNTRRLRPDQSSKESIKQGMATCTGLSIMLVEACRSVGVPARLAGIAAWPGRGGNHTWVEVWDDGWHCVGAAEPDEKGLDHAWFIGEAARAIKGSDRMRSTPSPTAPRGPSSPWSGPNPPACPPRM